MRMILKFLPTLILLPLVLAEACADAQAAAPTSGDFHREDGQWYFKNNVNVDGTLTAPSFNCAATTAWTGSALNFNASSNFAVNVATGTSTGTVTLGGTGTQTIAVGNGAGVKTVALGSATSTSSTAINAGTGDLTMTSVDDVTLNGGSAGSLINIGTNVDGNVFHIGDNDTAADTGTIGSASDTWTLTGISLTLGSNATTAATVLRSGTGDVTVTSTDDIAVTSDDDTVITATDDLTLTSGSTNGLVNVGTAAFLQTVVLGNSTTGTSITQTAGAGASTFDLNGYRVTMPATQVIGAGGTIAADACGGLKRLSSASSVTTDTTNTFTAPAAANAGCCMRVVNLNASDTITLDVNALTILAGAANVVLGTGDTVEVCSTGGSGAWYQIGATGNN